MDRKAFVFYKEWGEAIEDLPDAIRLEIYDSIIGYAFRGNHPDLKAMAKVAFGFIKGDLDRDISKYESKKEEKSRAGRMGNLKRWHKDLYEKIEKGEFTLEEAEIIAEGRKSRTAINAIAEIATKVEVEEEVKEENKKEVEVEMQNPDSAASFFRDENFNQKPISEIAKRIYSDNTMTDIMIRRHSVNILTEEGKEILKSLLSAFNGWLRSQNIEFKSESDYRQHFPKWMNQQPESLFKITKKGNKDKPMTSQQRESYEKLLKQYSGKDTAPEPGS